MGVVCGTAQEHSKVVKAKPDIEIISNEPA